MRVYRFVDGAFLLSPPSPLLLSCNQSYKSPRFREKGVKLLMLELYDNVASINYVDAVAREMNLNYRHVQRSLLVAG